jgi:hypothetical protein
VAFAYDLVTELLRVCPRGHKKIMDADLLSADIDRGFLGSLRIMQRLDAFAGVDCWISMSLIEFQPVFIVTSLQMKKLSTLSFGSLPLPTSPLIFGNEAANLAFPKPRK